MKLAFKISFILNLGLAGCLIYVLADQRRAGSFTSHPAVAEVGLPVQTVAASAPSVVQQAEPFRWSQLESADYRTYIRNLRNIGCPEPTLRAIVTADVGARYSRRSRELEQKLANLADSSWSVQFRSLNEQQALKAELQKLPDEEISEIADLLGWRLTPTREIAMDATSPSQVSSSQDSTSPPQVSRSRYNSQNGNAPVLPLVFREVNLSTLNLNSEQIQAITGLRQSFVDKIGGLNQDPSDPAYSERWQTAQPEIDLILQGMLGIMAWEDYQVATWNGH